MTKIQIRLPAKPKATPIPKPVSKPLIKIGLPTLKPAPKLPIVEVKPPPICPKIFPKISIKLPPNIPIYEELEHLYDANGNPIILDSDQLRAVELALDGKIFSITGKAGTGKSTIVQAISLLWLSRHNWEQIEYRVKGTGRHALAPSIAICAYTNQATDNIRNKLISHSTLRSTFGYNITTIHNLLEYTVEFITDEEGNNKRRYFPQKDRHNKLQITHLVVEEASMVGVGDTSLWQQLFEALPKGVQIVFLGDINQLPPVIGKSILNYALQQLPVAELDTVHRCALDNPIIRQALNCLEGKHIEEDYDKNSKQGVRIFNGKQKIKLSTAYYEIAIKRLLEKMIDAGEYDPLEDMILSPFFKENQNAVSAQNLAKTVASILASRENREVYEIIAGFQTIYLSVGDRVYLNKIEGVVTKIEHNALYNGKIPKPSSTGMDYWGQIVGKDISNGDVEFGDEFDFSTLDIEKMLDNSEGAEEERKRSASHIVHIKPRNFLSEDDEPVNTSDHTCSSVGDFASLTLGYALSVHKAQGSEWPNVILALHESNATLLFRELLYTGMTRARNRLDILAQAPVLEKARKNQRIKGNSLEAKIEFFNSGYLDQVVDIIPNGE